MIGLAPMIQESNPELLADPWGKWVHERFNAGPEGRMEAFQNIIEAGVQGINPFASNEAAQSVWVDFVDKADSYDRPGHFSAMTGFEWSSTPAGDNLHRVVVFRDGADKTRRTIPYSLFDSMNPEDLWEYLACNRSTKCSRRDHFTTPFCCYGNDADCNRCGSWGVFAIAARMGGTWDEVAS
jgi:hypothetical protein